MTDHPESAPAAGAELKPCPFCGGESIQPDGWENEDGECGPCCRTCGAGAADAAAWNIRAPAPPAEAQGDRLRTSLAWHYEPRGPSAGLSEWGVALACADEALSAPPRDAEAVGGLREGGVSRKLVMPNGEVLECEYPDSEDWAHAWSIRYPRHGQVGTTGEQDWEVVERYGLTALFAAYRAALASTPPSAPAPAVEDPEVTLLRMIGGDLPVPTHDGPVHDVPAVEARLTGEPRLDAIRRFRRLHGGVLQNAIDAVDGGWRPPASYAPAPTLGSGDDPVPLVVQAPSAFARGDMVPAAGAEGGLTALLTEALQYVSDARLDEDPETSRHASALADEIRAALITAARRSPTAARRAVERDGERHGTGLEAARELVAEWMRARRDTTTSHEAAADLAHRIAVVRQASAKNGTGGVG